MRLGKKVKDIGLISSFYCLRKAFYLFYLQRKYGFDRWHVGADYHCKPYKKQVINIINSLPNIKFAIEVGCGLGDILSRVKVQDKIGIDIEQNVINCAKALLPNLLFQKGDLNAVGNYIGNKEGVVLIAINWTHNVDFKDLINVFLQIINQDSVNCYVVVDAIKPNVKGYKYKHSISEYGNYFNVSTIDGVDGVRSFLTLSKL